MAEFTAEYQSLKPCFSFSDMDLNHMTQNPNFLENNPFINLQSFLSFSNEIPFALHQSPDFPRNLEENLPVTFHQTNQISQPTAGSKEFNESQKRKSMDQSESNSTISTPQVSENGSKRKNKSGRGKRLKISEIEEEKVNEVVHVRARRGQATDSHSLAERVRRGKINERLRCLQDIVPGCYKSMGMAVMLDEIINYVQSLQNQIEFLSMKLAAATCSYDFNLESDAIDMMQKAKAREAKELERLMREGYGGIACFHSTWSL